ncbi:MAG: hypothetical protein AAFY43_10360 [Pseudomonadota bacterium]
MRTSLLAGVIVAAMTVSVAAQDQQAGNEASTNAEDTFRKLIEKCDDTDMLMLRARIRLQFSRTTDAAGKEAGALLDQGFAQCGEGKLDEGKATLQKALQVAEAGVNEKLQEVTATAAAAKKEAEAAEEKKAAETKPWWQFW